jgi:hypothetical protein
VWRSVWSSRVLLKEGYRWKIGDGSKIPLWNTPWLRNETNLRIITQNTISDDTRKVSFLIDASLGCWDRQRVSEKFCDRDVKEILKIPLLNLGKKDEIIWRFVIDTPNIISICFLIVLIVLSVGRN